MIDLRFTLMYLGVPVRPKSYMLGDNKSVVNSSSIPTSTLSKKSTLVSCHRVRETIAAGYFQFNWKEAKSTPSDILSKHWEIASIWPLFVRRRSSDPDEQMNRQTCLLGVCLYVLVMLEVVNLARN